MDKLQIQNESKEGEPARPTAAATIEALGSNIVTGLQETDAASRLRRTGANEVLPEPSHPLLRFIRKFWGLSAWMIELIALLSFVLQKWTDFGIAVALLAVNAVLSSLEERRASDALSALRKRLQVNARVLRDGHWRVVPARDLVPGDIARVRSGDFVPADVQIIDGLVEVDQSALTGESQELTRSPNDTLYSGSVVRQGEASVVVVATGIHTYFGRTAQLVETARPQLHVENVIRRVVRWLALIVGLLVAVAFVYALVEGAKLADILPLSLVLLMSAVPVALPVMFTVSMAVGSIDLAKRGVLVTRLNAAEDAANMDVICVDKTGTLTTNRLALITVVPQSGFKESDVIVGGALASTEADQDPIDLAFLRAAKDLNLLEERGKIISFTPFSPKTRKTEANVKSGAHRIHVMKGAVRTVAEAAGFDATALAELEEFTDRNAQKGFRVLAVARAVDGEQLRLVGLALLQDPLRPDVFKLMDELRSLGVEIKMLTGDALGVAKEVAHEINLGEIVRADQIRNADKLPSRDTAQIIQSAAGFAEVFPEDKFLIIKGLQAAGHIVGMTGDGVNDAPALRQAEVGVAVRDATDVAKAAASAVLTSEGLNGIIALVNSGRSIYQRVLTWIVNKVSRTILKAGFVVVAFLATGKFTISALGMILLVFMTDFVKIALSTDRVHPSRKPETWNIGPLVLLAVILGLVMLAEALGLFAFGWHRFALAMHPGRLQTFTFQTLLFFALFSIVSIRERRAFWRSWPSVTMMLALLADACVGLAIGVFGLGELHPLPISQTTLVVGVSLVCCLGINDLVKSWLISGVNRHAVSTASNTSAKL